MTWGKGRWGVQHWGTAAINPQTGSKFEGNASLTATTLSKFAGSAGYPATPVYSKFSGGAGKYYVILSKFEGISTKIVITFFTGVAQGVGEFISKFAGSAGVTETIFSKFSGSSGAYHYFNTKFEGVCEKAKELTTYFTGNAARNWDLWSKFSGDAAVYLDTESKFAGDASVARSITASMFEGLVAEIGVITSKFEGMAYKARYYALGGLDITNKLFELKYDGFGSKTNAIQVPGSDEVELTDMGADPGIATLDLKFKTDTELQEFTAAVSNLSRDLVFIPGRDDRYMTASRVSITPVESLHLRSRFRVLATLTFAKKYALDVVPWSYGGYMVYAFPAKTPVVENRGSYKSRFTFNIACFYNGVHATYLVANLYNGATVEKTFPISDKLLSGESMTLDEAGVITGLYEDSYATYTKFGCDAWAVNAAWSSGKVRISQNGRVTYRFAGPLLLDKAIKLIADLTVVGGAPLIQISVDDEVSYSTAVPATEIVNGLYTYWLSGSEKYGDVYVRFYCPAGATLDINSVSFTTVRDLTQTAYYNQIPEIPVGESREFELTGVGLINMTITHRNRWAP